MLIRMSQRPRYIWKITEWKGDSVSKSKKIGISIESEYSKVPCNVNMALGVIDFEAYDMKDLQILTSEEIIKICGYR